MKYESNNIISRIEWCRLQQRLDSVTMDERAGWRAEEAGLMDALDRRDRTSVHESGIPLSVHTLSMRSRRWARPSFVSAGYIPVP